MALTRSLAEITLAARRLADMEVSTFVSDAEVTFIVNQRIAQLYARLVVTDSDRYAIEGTLTTTSSATPPWFVALPADFYVLRGVDLQRGGQRFPLESYALQERVVGGAVDAWLPYERVPLRYRLANNGVDGADAALYFDRNPGNATIIVYYVPNAPRLADGEDVIDGFAGWEDWIVYKTAITLLTKEQSDTSALERECAAIEASIKHLSSIRDAGEAPSVVNVYTYRGRGGRGRY